MSITTGIALAGTGTTYDVNWYQDASCGVNAKCGCREVSGYVQGSEAFKKTIAPLNPRSWSSMPLVNSNPNPLVPCTMVLTATDCSYYACKSIDSSTSKCGTWTDSGSITLSCRNGKSYVEYYTNTGFKVRFSQ